MYNKFFPHLYLTRTKQTPLYSKSPLSEEFLPTGNGENTDWYGPGWYVRYSLQVWINVDQASVYGIC